MCGIAGAVNFKLPYEHLNKLMLHRGPDEQQAFAIDNIDLYHFRLSILDVAGGKQPMHLHERYSIVFNGEIYNHSEIRNQHGLQGQTASDTETLLLLYEKFGAQALHFLDGMFAFAIYDRKEKKLFIARDRAGKKPVYYYLKNDQFVFASELNALKGMLPLEKNDTHLCQYLRLGSFYGSSTPYYDVHELQAGSYLEVDCVGLSVAHKKWWDIQHWYENKKTDDFDTALEKVDSFLHRGIQRRVESSDLEVGSFLSGGIDSGLVTAIAKQYNSQLKTFTVSFKGEYDEAPLAKLVADRFQTNHTQINISFDQLQSDVEKILCNYGEPFFDSSAIPSYYVSKAAKKHLTVILNGDGADELFGGYRRYVPFARYDFFKSGGWMKNAANLLNKVLPKSHSKKSLYNYLYRLSSLASKDSVEIYLSAGVDIFEDYEHLIHPLGGPDYISAMRKDFDLMADSHLSGLKKIMNMDFKTTLFTDLLVKMDIATMAHSLEGRSPFLCKELLEYAPGLDDRFKIHGRATKYLLRQLAKKYLPPQIIHQPKRGFEIPLKSWVNGELKDIIHDYIGASNALSRQLLQPGALDKIHANQNNIPAEKRAKMLWTLFSLECWYQRVYLQ